MVNYFLILCLSLICTGISTVEGEEPPLMAIVTILEQFMTDEQCAKKVKDSIKSQFEELVKLQKEKAYKIQELLKPYRGTLEGNKTANLFSDWHALETQKTKIVTDNLTTLLNCSAVFRAGTRIAAVPGQIAHGAQQAADATKQAVIKGAQAVKTGTTIAVGIPVAAAVGTYNAGKQAVNTTVNAATEAKKNVESKINQAENAIVKKRDSLIDRLTNWLASWKRDQPQLK